MSESKIDKTTIQNVIATAKIPFPCQTIDQCFENHLCKRCQRPSSKKGQFLQCDACGSKSLFSLSKSRYAIKGTFVDPVDKSTKKFF